MAASRGPVPKRSDQRRRRNAPDAPVADPAAQSAEPPPADEGWHPIARAWYEALAESGQSVFFEASDWATAVLVAESISRDLSPQPVGVTEDGRVVKDTIPLKGASLSSYLKAFSNLLVTEGDRRRMRVELQQPESAEGEEVASLDDYRRRLAGTG